MPKLKYKHLENTLHHGQRIFYKNENTEKVCKNIYQILFAIENKKPWSLKKSNERSMMHNPNFSSKTKELLQFIKGNIDKLNIKRNGIYKKFGYLFQEYYKYTNVNTEVWKENYQRRYDWLADIKSNSRYLNPEDYLSLWQESDYIFESLESQKDQLNKLLDILRFIKKNPKYFLILSDKKEIKLFVENIDNSIWKIEEEIKDLYNLQNDNRD